MQEIQKEVPCDDCSQPCGIFVCTGCWEKNLKPGLKKAIKIVDNRLATAKALGCGEEYLAAFDEIQVFLKAELWRQENPEEAKKSATTLGAF